MAEPAIFLLVFNNYDETEIEWAGLSKSTGLRKLHESPADCRAMEEWRDGSLVETSRLWPKRDVLDRTVVAGHELIRTAPDHTILKD